MVRMRSLSAGICSVTASTDMPTRVRVERERVQSAALRAFSKDGDGGAQFDNSIMQVGIVDTALKYPDGTRVVDVAHWNEFGTSRIPPRPALRRAIKKASPELAKLGAVQAKEMLHGRLRFDVAARRLARILAAEMKAQIESLRTPPNAPSTVKRKGFNNPLIDTRLYKNSIGFKLLKTRKDQ